MSGNLIAPNVQNAITIVIMGAIGYALLMMVHKFVAGKMAANSAQS